MRFVKLNTGDMVVEVDGRHVGRVDAIYGGLAGDCWHVDAEVKVRWLESGHLSMLRAGDLVRITPRTGHPAEREAEALIEASNN